MVPPPEDASPSATPTNPNTNTTSATIAFTATSTATASPTADRSKRETLLGRVRSPSASSGSASPRTRQRCSSGLSNEVIPTQGEDEVEVEEEESDAATSSDDSGGGGMQRPTITTTLPRLSHGGDSTDNLFLSHHHHNPPPSPIIGARGGGTATATTSTSATDRRVGSSSSSLQEGTHSPSHGWGQGHKTKFNLLDVDSIRGSSSYYTKPIKDSGLQWRGFSKVVFFPFHREWWIVRKHMSVQAYLLGCCLYVAQALILVLHVRDSLPLYCPQGSVAEDQQDLLQVQVYMPMVLWLFCAIGYGHVLAAAEARPSSSNKASSSGGSDVSLNGLGHDGRQGVGGGACMSDEEEEEEDEEDDALEEHYSTELHESEQKMLRARENLEPLLSSLVEGDDRVDREEEGMWGLGGLAVGAVRVGLFDGTGEIHKTPMTLSQIRNRIVQRANAVKQDHFYSWAAPVGALITALVPTVYYFVIWWDGSSPCLSLPSPLPTLTSLLDGISPCTAYFAAVGALSYASVLYIAWPIFNQLAMTEYTYQRRYQYAKYFAAITSSIKARRYNIPHFSLKNVLNIKMWLALRAGRSWLRKYEEQRVADTVVSTTFRATVLLLLSLGVELFVSKEKRPFLSRLLHWELLAWTIFISIYLLRFMILGARINDKYHDTTVLLTEQINVQLRIFENTCRDNDRTKRDKLQISNTVLKLASKLLKEIDSPNRVSGLSMNPFLYNITRVVLLSALSAAMSDQLGFKLKFWKLLKIK